MRTWDDRNYIRFHYIMETILRLDTLALQFPELEEF